MGIGDVSQPLCRAAVNALHRAVDDQGEAETFHGYMPECGAPFLRETIASHYAKRGVKVGADEVFVSSGASDELGDIPDLFDRDNTVLIPEPAYPAYVDANIIAGHRIIHLPTAPENGFVPLPDKSIVPDIIYLCSPNNPTGAVMSSSQLKAWVDFANACGAVILFDAAYEAFIEDEAVPHSIFEIPGARTCAVEICSLSKTAGFTGTRLGYTVIPKELERCGMNFNAMWVRNRTTKTNGISYILQRGGAAIFTDDGQAQIKRQISIYKNNAKILMSALDDIGIRYTGGKNAPYIWLRTPDNMTSWDFFDYLLDKAHVVGTPGSGFGPSGEHFFRLTAFGTYENTVEAIERIKKL